MILYVFKRVFIAPTLNSLVNLLACVKAERLKVGKSLEESMLVEERVPFFSFRKI